MHDLKNSWWRISGGFEIIHHCFGEQYAVYHSGSGDTHLLDEAGFFVLNAINHGTSTCSELAEKLSTQFEFESTQQSREFLNTLLGEFQKLSLIERLER